MLLRAVILGIVGVCAVSGAGCDRSPAAAATPGAPVTGRGFRYDAASGEAGFATIQMGAHLRMFVVLPEWTPATVTLLDEQGATVRVFRLDLPPQGVIDADVPELAASEKMQVYFARVATPFERRIGVNEAMLTTERVKEIAPGVIQEEAGEKRWEIDVKGLQTSVKPGTRRVCVVGLEHTFFESVSGADAARVLSDEDWLTPAVREAIAKAKTAER